MATKPKEGGGVKAFIPALIVFIPECQFNAINDDISAKKIMRFTFQTLNSISAEKNSTIIFPVPMDLIRSLAN